MRAVSASKGVTSKKKKGKSAAERYGALEESSIFVDGALSDEDLGGNFLHQLASYCRYAYSPHPAEELIATFRLANLDVGPVKHGDAVRALSTDWDNEISVGHVRTGPSRDIHSLQAQVEPLTPPTEVR